MDAFDKEHADEKAREQAEQQEYIADAEIIRNGLENPPEFWKIVMKYFNKFKEDAHKRCFDRTNLPSDPMARLIDTEVYMLSYLMIQALIEMPDKVVEKGKEAIEALIEQGKDAQKVSEAIKFTKDPVTKR